MFDIGFWELCLIGVLALIVLGPERLPQVARTAGLWMGRARRFLGDVKADIDRELREGELSAVRELRDEIRDAGKDFSKAGEALNKPVDDIDNLTSNGSKPTEAPDQPARVLKEPGPAETASSTGDEQPATNK